MLVKASSKAGAAKDQALYFHQNLKNIYISIF
jgi:hypothetical protein